jgi:hypothetical protein
VDASGTPLCVATLFRRIQEEFPHGTQIFQVSFEGRRARFAQGEARDAQERAERKEVTSRKQAIAIGLSEARKKGKKVPKKKAS